jgi:hypothetical protein
LGLVGDPREVVALTKHRSVLRPRRPSPLQGGGDRLADVARQRQPLGPPALATHDDLARAPVENPQAPARRPRRRAAPRQQGQIAKSRRPAALRRHTRAEQPPDRARIPLIEPDAVLNVAICGLCGGTRGTSARCETVSIARARGPPDLTRSDVSPGARPDLQIKVHLAVRGVTQILRGGRRACRGDRPCATWSRCAMRPRLGSGRSRPQQGSARTLPRQGHLLQRRERTAVEEAAACLAPWGDGRPAPRARPLGGRHRSPQRDDW